ncbi:MAG: 2-oxoglutarate ferredoxin oxidoreductase subunit alpha [Gammaproteobacteria bacterium]|nr:MAG: 2-oxoglutarate ferredoxin oxidoreductase subunit alpha [Gammaproteobacteria bacterium]
MPEQISKESIVVRLAGDSGDGVQLMGSQFIASTALSGDDFSTFPDFPAEIRAPVGTTFGVSAYQMNIGVNPITTAGDTPDILAAFNPAALKVSLPLLKSGALLIVNNDSFTGRNLTKAGYTEDPRETGELDTYQVISVDIGRLNLEAVKPFGLSKSDGGRCKNFWALGLLMWMFDRDLSPIEDWISKKFVNKDIVRDANLAALHAGHAYGETAELSEAIPRFDIATAELPAGEYRGITGAEALSLGLAAAGELADRPVLFCSYPITPASPLLHRLSRFNELGVGTFQAEDEIAAICAAIGASYGGAIGVTSSSGPGIALKTEAIGLAVNAELPLVIVNSQRGGPSTGLPTKTEQSDLYQAVYGRNGDTPIPVIAARSPGDCFFAAIEATRIALRHMTPVMLLSDGYISNAAEPWRIPDMNDIEPIEINAAPEPDDARDSQAMPFERNPETHGRPWITPGMPNLMHRLGGLEKDFVTGNISYDADNHQRMTDMRAAKVASVGKFIPRQTMELGDDEGELLVIGWGSTYGPIFQAVQQARQTNTNVSFAHLRYLHPLPENLGKLIGNFNQLLVPEMNMGQLSTVLRDQLGSDPTPLCKVTGQPYQIAELFEKIRSMLPSAAVSASSPGAKGEWR